MKRTLPEKVEYNRVSGPANSRSGATIIKHGNAYLRVIFSDGIGWNHVSVSLPTRCPSWEEMCYVKNVFFDPEETVMQLHPPESTYVNNHPFCLHLWQPQSEEELAWVIQAWGDEWIYGDVQAPGEIPVPPEFTVGIKELGTLK
jgi:hypothetical protein